MIQIAKLLLEWCRLLNTLTQALQSSGVDLSQAGISVQIDLGKQASRRPSGPQTTVKVSS